MIKMKYRVSMHAQYVFKADYCRTSLGAIYLFNGSESFIDFLNHKYYNSCKRSWDSWYYMYCDEKDRVYYSKPHYKIWR